ncbi:MAG: hypothetical protein ACOC4J_04290 [Bacteroidota bacterium]
MLKLYHALPSHLVVPSCGMATANFLTAPLHWSCYRAFCKVVVADLGVCFGGEVDFSTFRKSTPAVWHIDRKMYSTNLTALHLQRFDISSPVLQRKGMEVEKIQMRAWLEELISFCGIANSAVFGVEMQFPLKRGN